MAVFVLVLFFHIHSPKKKIILWRGNENTRYLTGYKYCLSIFTDQKITFYPLHTLSNSKLSKLETKSHTLVLMNCTINLVGGGHLSFLRNLRTTEMLKKKS